MDSSTQRPASPLSPGLAFFIACFAVFEHALLLGIASALMPLAAGLFCLAESGNALIAALLFGHLRRTQTDPVLPLFATAIAAGAVPWTVLFFSAWGLVHGLGPAVGFVAPYLLATVLATLHRLSTDRPASIPGQRGR